MSALVDGAIARAGLEPLAEARRAGDWAAVEKWVTELQTVDLLALGALADRVRAEEVGDIVGVFERDDDLTGVVTVQGPHEGLAFLRALAVARVTGAPRARIRVNWTDIGLELAQVALGFGASELAGTLSSKRGLPLAEGELRGSGKRSARELASLVKRRELAGFIERSGRRPLFVHADGTSAPPGRGPQEEEERP